MRKKLTNSKESLNNLLEFQKTAAQKPIFFLKEAFGVIPWQKQKEIILSVRDNPRTTVRSCHGIGKSFIAANTILWFLFSHINSIVISTAPTFRQVDKLIWKEVRASFNNKKIPLGGNLYPSKPEIQLNPESLNTWFACGLSTNEPNNFQGFHEDNILLVVDEAAGVSEDIFEASEGILTTEGAKLLLLGNPTDIGGTFFKSFKEPGWKRIKVSAFDTPNFTEFGITEEDIRNNTWETKITRDLPNPKLITPSWVYDKYLRWGETSPAYLARVKGDFPVEGSDTLIPLSWVEAAMARYNETPISDPIELGVDVARFGSDRTVIATRLGQKILPLDVIYKNDTMEVAGRVAHHAKTCDANAIKVDVIGLGAGVVDRLNELKLPVFGINVAESARDPEMFANLRSELWWNLRERLNINRSLNPNPIALPHDDELLDELSSVKYKYNSRGQIQLEPKDEMKKRLGKSPDLADAVVNAFAPNIVEQPKLSSEIILPTRSKWK